MSKFILGLSADSDLNGVIVDNVTDGGFFETPLNSFGRYLTIGRDLAPISGTIHYNLNQLKAYQTPNLLKINERNVGITSDTLKSVAGFEAINLV